MAIMDFLRRCHIDLAEEYEALFLNQRPAKALRTDEQQLILLGVYAAFGSEDDVIEHGDRALQAGASPDAAVEAVLTAAISRGPKALRTALPFLSRLSEGGGKTGRSCPAQPAIRYFASEFEELPDWIRQLEEFSPDSLARYAVLRSGILTDGAASRKIKELLTMLLNAIAANPSGIRSHAIGATRFGASKDEIFDVLLLGVRIGGIVVWINGINSLPEGI